MYPRQEFIEERRQPGKEDKPIHQISTAKMQTNLIYLRDRTWHEQEE